METACAKTVTLKQTLLRPSPRRLQPAQKRQRGEEAAWTVRPGCRLPAVGGTRVDALWYLFMAGEDVMDKPFSVGTASREAPRTF